jgi:hypothetical protein
VVSLRHSLYKCWCKLEEFCPDPYVPQSFLQVIIHYYPNIQHSIVKVTDSVVKQTENNSNTNKEEPLLNDRSVIILSRVGECG